MTKQVQLSDEAYARLAALKQPGESFSGVVLRVTPRPSLAALLKAVGRTPEELEAHRKMLREMDALDEPPARGRRR